MSEFKEDMWKYDSNAYFVEYIYREPDSFLNKDICDTAYHLCHWKMYAIFSSLAA